MKINILNGVYTCKNTDYKTSYPVNMIPVVQDTGVSAGYLRPVEGILKTGVGVGLSRGAINWNNQHFRVMGSNLCLVSDRWQVTIIGDVGDDRKNVSFAYSFDRLAIASAGKLYYYDGNTLDQVTDTDLGTVLDVVWIDGYFFTTDGEFIVSTDIKDATKINPFSYEASELDPDPINSLIKLRNELYVVNRYTIEVFSNANAGYFPFKVIRGAQIQRGALGTFCSVVYENSIAFLGSSKNEAPSIYLGLNASTAKISTREIDELLLNYSEEALAGTVMETINDKGHALLWIRLPDRTLVYDLLASQQLGEPVWHIMTSSARGFEPYRARDVIWCYDKWQVADTKTKNLGILDNNSSHHFGEVVRWEFGTKIVYNESKGALFKSLELVALTGRSQGFEDPVISTSYSLDGRAWSQEKFIKVGKLGDRLKRLVWWRQGHMKNFRMQRFSGDSKAYIAVSRLEADLEPLGY